MHVYKSIIAVIIKCSLGGCNCSSYKRLWLWEEISAGWTFVLEAQLFYTLVEKCPLNAPFGKSFKNQALSLFFVVCVPVGTLVAYMIVRVSVYKLITQQRNIKMPGSVSSTQLDYMTILVEQLKNQNPLEPMENSDMTSQLTQFSQLEVMQNMDSNFENVLQKTQQAYAETLIGKKIMYYDSDSNLTTGVCELVYNNLDDEVVLVIGDDALSLEGVVAVMEDSSTESTETDSTE